MFYEKHKDGHVAIALTVAPTTAFFENPGVALEELVHFEVPEDKEYVKQKNMLYTFIVDRSGSMSGPRMQATKEAMKLFLQSLKPDANFCVISFGSRHEFMQINGERILNQRTHYNEATAKIALFEANFGGTEILTPMTKAMQMLQDAEAIKKELTHSRIFLLTDGEVENRDQVIDAAVVHPSANVSLHTFGIGGQCDKDMV